MTIHIIFGYSTDRCTLWLTGLTWAWQIISPFFLWLSEALFNKINVPCESHTHKHTQIRTSTHTHTLALSHSPTLKRKIAFLVLPFITFPPFLSYNIRYHIIFSPMLNYIIANNFMLLMLNYINANNLILMWTQTPSNEQDQILSIELISYLNTCISH